MPTHGSVAKAARENKEQHPERYCSDRRCLYRLTVDMRAEGIDRCPRHTRRGA